MRRRITLSLVPVLLSICSVFSVTSCGDQLPAIPDDQYCVDDNDCNSDQRCVLGTCIVPSDVDLDAVDLDISPFNAELAPHQQVLNVNVDVDNRFAIPVQSESRMQGRVLDSLAQPVPAHIVALPENSIPGRTLSVSTSSDAESGEFLLRLIKGQAYRFVVYPDDEQLAPIYLDTAFLPQETSGSLNDFVLPDSETQVQIQGRVTAGSGAETLGIPGLAVRFLRRERRASSTAITDDDGRFSVRITILNDELTLDVKPTEANLSFPTLAVPGYVFNEDLVLGDVDLGAALFTPVPVSGTVLGPGGQKVAEALVYFSAELGAGTLKQEVRCNAAGEFQLSLPPGNYHFASVAPASDTDAGMLASLNQDIVLDSPPLVLSLAPRVPFSGHLLDAEGDVVARNTVRLVRLEAPTGEPEKVLHGVTWEFTTRTGDDGSFALRIDPGRYRLSFIPEPLSLLPQHTQIVDVFTDPSDNDFLLPSSGFIFGTLTSENGNPRTDLSGSFVRAFAPFASEGGESQQLGDAIVDANGDFTLVLPNLSEFSILRRLNSLSNEAFAK
ncbi:MAG: carboxypeptidase regulatory-like domain-containing protein [Deltaproteobacteria bacterium]|nr:carboxypeptidase regulatory-like domain-containing protein [Deltaproteobacteria bacterium]